MTDYYRAVSYTHLGLPEEILTSELVKEVYDVELDIRSVDGKPFVIPV